ncbi:DUF4178 domain-containing protein [Gordonia amarae]|uniref:DUF4178 domain-containing protein n=2 Tax=Gordonia amarae TaxID=36821 RepID=G7GWH9_9ACTN|nr:DUF4178 domain-containing protein [Gordonia amarae]MCS3877276.1 hypothetical protein [Gordonia amarae]QHN16046.1 DUF4178 domain-containing protein [Gordonia amarae]QHN20614.1 DUF4178 domain-containing protein [Gordonia amarae]QHN29466.1 DUF4178 domain-containing protein [Gordonia amarae]QHN38242.1 DUF4178 domain-containing protein [Gordonia amarae]
MEYLLIIVVALLAIIAVVVIFNFLGNRRARQAQTDAVAARAYAPRDPFSSADDDAVRGNPRNLVPGDMIEIRGQTFAVRGTLRLRQDGYEWTENFIDTGTGRKSWISVEDDPDLEVVLWQEVGPDTISPGPYTLDLDGRRYTSDESGQARFTSTGTTGVAASGVMAYHDYESGDQRLSFEDYGSGWEAARGEVLGRGEYRIYPSTTPGV